MIKKIQIKNANVLTAGEMYTAKGSGCIIACNCDHCGSSNNDMRFEDSALTTYSVPDDE